MKKKSKVMTLLSLAATIVPLVLQIKKMRDENRKKV